MRQNLIHETIPILLFILLLGGCASAYRPGSEELDLAITPTPPIIAYDKAEVYRAIATSPWESVEKVSKCSSSTIAYWNINTSLKDYRPHRAFALGYPYDCGGSWHAWSYRTESSAAEAALNRCLEYLSGIEKHTGHKCGARLVLIDQRLLVSKEEIPTKSRVPFIMEVIPLTGEKFSIYGMFEYEGPGQDRRLEVFNEKGENVCTGEYSLSYLQAIFGSGDFKMNCFGGKFAGHGTLSTKRIKLRHVSGESSVAIGKGKSSDGGQFRFLTGINIDQFEKYKDLLE
jgi:hypothetical protein